MVKKKKLNNIPEVNKTVEQAKQTQPTTQPSLLQDIVKLLIKIAVIALAFVLLFSFIFGAYRYNDMSMDPAVKDGDLVITYRWDKHYSYNDLVCFWYNKQSIISRVIAQEGDEVNIDGEGLKVNGHKLTESGIYEETTMIKDSNVKFPLTVPDNEVFVLGDARSKAIDSRTFGCVEVEKTEGKIIGLFRHRGI